VKFSEVFSSDGRYSRSQYNITQIVTHLLAMVLVFLVVVSPWLLIPAVPAWLVLWFIDMQSTVKRLHDLGREEGDIFKLLIPFVGTFMDLRLHYQSGEKEGDIEAFDDYQRYMYDKKMGSHSPKDDLGRPL
jgi:uncharacterized membrane protein YhaH (DUF805 family)